MGPKKSGGKHGKHKRSGNVKADCAHPTDDKQGLVEREFLEWLEVMHVSARASPHCTESPPRLYPVVVPRSMTHGFSM